MGSCGLMFFKFRLSRTSSQEFKVYFFPLLRKWTKNEITEMELSCQCLVPSPLFGL